MIYSDNLPSKSHFYICYFIMLSVATNRIPYHNYREGSEAHCA